MARRARHSRKRRFPARADVLILMDGVRPIAQTTRDFLTQQFGAGSNRWGG
jgi:hypothetical protein